MRTLTWSDPDASALTWIERAYSPSEPRDYHGRWTSGGIASDATPEYRRTVGRIAGQIRNEPIEHAYIVGPDGQVRFKTDGEEGHVVIPGSEAHKILGSGFMHNHPRSMPQPPSPEDVLGACYANAKELRVATTRGVYVLRAPSGRNWHITDWRDHKGPVLAAYDAASKAVQSGQIKRDQAYEMVDHAWGVFARDIPGARYGRLP